YVLLEDVARNGLQVTWRALRRAGPPAGRAVWLGLTFLFYLLDEWLRGPRGHYDTSEDSPSSDQDECGRQQDAYAAALARFGLAAGFTQTDLRRAYMRAIRKAHPDAGGSAALAQ